MALRAPLGGLRRHREGLLLGGLILALAAAVVAEALPQPLPDALSVPHHPPALPRLGHPDTVSPDTAAWGETVLARPLFALDRRPQPQAAGPDASLPRLSGTIRFGQTALAIFDVPTAADPTSGGQAAGGPALDAPAQTLVLGVGSVVAGWTIDEIGDEHVLITKGDEVQALQLAYAKAPAAPLPAQKVVSTLRVLHGKKSNVFWQP